MFNVKNREFGESESIVIYPFMAISLEFFFYY